MANSYIQGELDFSSVPRLVWLACGHSYSPPGAPANGWHGAWITCPDGKCQSQRRVVAVEYYQGKP